MYVEDRDFFHTPCNRRPHKRGPRWIIAVAFGVKKLQ